MTDAAPISIEERLDSTDGIREQLISALLTSSADGIQELVKEKDAMTHLTTLLRDRDSTNSKRLRISADKEMAKKSGEEALEIARMVIEAKKRKKAEREANPQAHEEKRTLRPEKLPEIAVTDDLTHVGITDLSLDKFVKAYEEERGISGRR